MTRSFERLLWMIPIAGAVSVALLGTSALNKAVAPRRLTSVQVLTDRLYPIPGGAVRLVSGMTEVVTVTDADGQTPWHELDVSGGVRLTLEELTLPSGIAVGMIEQLELSSDPEPGDDALFTVISRTQPFAVPVLVEGAPSEVNNIGPPPGDWPHWTIVVPAASPLRFATHVASLLDAPAIEQYLAYRGHHPDPGLQYVRGVSLVMPAIQLAPSGLVVGIRLLGDLSGGLSVDAYNFAAASFAPVGPELSIGILDVVDDVVYVEVNGSVARGHLALLARAGTGAGNAYRFADQPPQVIVPPHGGRGVESVLGSDCLDCDDSALHSSGAGVAGSAGLRQPTTFVTACEPPVPDMGPWTCAPLIPPATACGSWSASGAVECRTVRMRTARLCRPPGATLKATTARMASWKVSFSLSSGPSSSPLTSGGGFTYGESSTTTEVDEWTAGQGAHGLGQCTRYFRFELICAREFTNQRDKFIVGEHPPLVWIPCGGLVTSVGVCRDTTSSQSVCDQTP